jgi:transposase-like protein
MFMARGVDLDQKAVEKDAKAGRDRKSNLVKLNRRYTRKSKYVQKVATEDEC